MRNDIREKPDGAASPKIERLIVEIEDSLTVFPEGFRFERIIPQDPEFEERHRRFGLHRWYYASCDSIAATRAAADLEGLPGIMRVAREPRLSSDAIPFNDPFRGNQWHLFNDGKLLTKAVEGADINVVPVWNDFTAGSSEVIVGVVDTGIQYDHPDLSGVVIPAGPDGSKSFLESASADPYEIVPQRHGTHVAGIIGAINNNGKGVCGIAGGKDGKGGVRILDCPAIPAIEGDRGNVYSAIVWAADHGAVILNNSWNNKYDSESAVPSTTDYFTKMTLDYFIQNAGTDKNGNQTGPMKGGLVVFSAGNNSWTKSQPSMYENVLAVGALGPAGEATTYTNYGDWVDLCAPGGNASAYSSSPLAQIYSTMAGGGYYQMQGTSQAAPAVSGVAALIVSKFGGPGFTCGRLKEILISGADREMMATHTRYIGPVVDAYGSFMYAMDESLRTADDVLGFQTPQNSLGVSWTIQKYGTRNVHKSIVAVCDDPSKFEGLDPLNLPSGFISKTVKGSEFETGGKATATVEGLSFGKDYYYAVAAYTKSLMTSGWSTPGKIRLRANQPPTLTSDYKWEVSLNHHAVKVFTAKYNDPDGDELDIKLNPASTAAVWHDDGAGTLTLTITGKDAPAGSYIATASVSDGICTADIYIIYTLLPNKLPVITQEGVFPEEFKYRDEAAILMKFRDPDSDTLTVSTDPGSPAGSWVNNGNDSYTLTVRGDSAPAGTYSASITVSDGFGGSASAEVRYTLCGNSAPQLAEAIQDRLITAGTDCTVNLSGHFSDPDGDPLSFSAEASEGISARIEGNILHFSAEGPLAGTITASASDGISAPVKTSFRISAHNRQESQADIYPDTVTDKLNILGTSEQKLKILIINSTGRTVYSREITTDPYSPYIIDVSGLAPGRYTVIIESKKEKTSKRIIKI